MTWRFKNLSSLVASELWGLCLHFTLFDTASLPTWELVYYNSCQWASGACLFQHCQHWNSRGPTLAQYTGTGNPISFSHVFTVRILPTESATNPCMWAQTHPFTAGNLFVFPLNYPHYPYVVSAWECCLCLKTHLNSECNSELYFLRNLCFVRMTAE